MLHLLIKHADGKYVAVVNRRLTKKTSTYYYSEDLLDAFGYKESSYKNLERHCEQYNNGRTDGKQMVICDNQGIYEILDQKWEDENGYR